MSSTGSIFNQSSVFINAMQQLVYNLQVFGEKTNVDIGWKNIDYFSVNTKEAYSTYMD
jgi:hypothetical protein